MFLLHKNAPRGCDQMHENTSQLTRYEVVYFCNVFLLRCYIVERGKNAGGKSGQKGSCRCRISERGKTDVDNELFMKLYGAYQKELYLYLYSLLQEPASGRGSVA